MLTKEDACTRVTELRNNSRGAVVLRGPSHAFPLVVLVLFDRGARLKGQLAAVRQGVGFRHQGWLVASNKDLVGQLCRHLLVVQ